MTRLEKLMAIEANGYRVCSGTLHSESSEQMIIITRWKGKSFQSWERKPCCQTGPAEWNYYDSIDTAYKQLVKKKKVN